MFTKRRFVCAVSMVVAALTAACSEREDVASLSPTSPSISLGQTSASRHQEGFTVSYMPAQSEACGAFGSGDTFTIPVGPPPAGAPLVDVVFAPAGRVGFGNGEIVGAPPAAPPEGATLAIGGAIDSVEGSCPLITFTIHGQTVRTDSGTSFGGSCESLRGGERVRAMGTVQGDGSMVASCVAAGM